MTKTAARSLTIDELAPDDLPADVLDLLYDELYRDFGVARDQDWLNADDAGLFFVARDRKDGHVCGAGRLMPPGKDASQRGLQIRQLATAPHERGRGVGTAVMDALERDAITVYEFPRVWLKARQQAWGFYQKRGYQFAPPEFTAGECLQEDGLFISHLTGIPHRIMAKRC